MARLPVRQLGQSGRPGKRIPNPITASNIPSVPLTQAPGPVTPAGAFGGGIADAAGDVGQVVGAIGAKRNAEQARKDAETLKVQQRIQNTEDQIDINRNVNEFKEAGTVRLAQDDRDNKLGDRGFADAYGQSLREEKDKTLAKASASGLSVIGLKKLELELDAALFSLAKDASKANTQARADIANRDAILFIDDFNEAPEREDETFILYKDGLRELLGSPKIAPTLQAGQEELIYQANVDIEFAGRFGKLLTSTKKGSLDIAEDFLDDHNQDLSPEEASRARESLSTFRSGEKDAVLEARNKLIAGAVIYGKTVEELTQTERYMIDTGKIPPAEKADEQTLTEWAAEFKELTGADPTPEQFAIKTGLREKDKKEKLTVLSPGDKAITSESDDRTNPKAKPKTPTELGVDEATQFLSKTEALKKGGFEEDTESTLVDESGNVKPEATRAMNRFAVQAFGGTMDISGKVVGGLDQKKGQFIAKLLTKAEELVREKIVHGTGEAVLLAMQSFPEDEIPKDVTLESLAEDVLASANVEVKDGEVTTTEQAKASFDGTMTRYSSEIKKIKAEDATGLKSGAIELISNTIGQISSQAATPEVTRARVQASLLAKDIVRMIILSTRFAQTEQALIGLFVEGPALFQSPPVFRERMREFEKEVDFNIKLNRGFVVASDVPVKTKLEAIDKLKHLGRLKSRLAKFDLSPGGINTANIQTPKDVAKASLQEVDRFSREAGEEAIANLPPETQVAIAKKLGVDMSEESPDEVTVEDINAMSRDEFIKFSGSTSVGESSPEVRQAVTDKVTELLEQNVADNPLKKKVKKRKK